MVEVVVQFTESFGVTSPSTMRAGMNEADYEDTKGGAICKALVPGYYYFNDGARNVKGQMLTGKQAYEDDGETYYYYFDKSTGRALTNEVKDGVLYGSDGKRIQADDGNANMLYETGSWIKYKNEWIKPGSMVIVSSTGKLRISGVVRVDGVKYEIKKDAVTDPDYTIYEWSVVEKED